MVSMPMYESEYMTTYKAQSLGDSIGARSCLGWLDLGSHNLAR